VLKSDDVQKAAKLARLPLQDSERQAIERDLTDVVAHVDELFSADVDDAAPMERGPLVEPRLRPDEERDVLGRQALEGSVGFDGALVRVPKVIE
jgi:aspartyl/glutamyl-tRNA(Asn/Gln) amidotransferase C subunit